MGHAVRSCAIGMRLGEAIGLDAATRSSLFYALLLKDAGCSSNAARMWALFGADDPRSSGRSQADRPPGARPEALATVARTPGRPLQNARRARRAGPQHGGGGRAR